MSTPPHFNHTRLGFLILLASLFSTQIQAVEISETTYEGRAQFLIRTESATWYLDRAGGGFSRLIDQDGQDWIHFRKNPLKQFPASAAAGYRGIPNLVYGSMNPDAGAGHPGFDRCRSVQLNAQTIQTTSLSRKWRWSWRFTESHAVFTMEKTDPEHAWWFLYEGPIAGSFAPKEKYWATDELGLSTDIPSKSNQLFGQWQWAYFGDRRTPRVLYLVQHEIDPLPDTLWYLGSSDGGSSSAVDGMMVFGFGRGPKTTPQFRKKGISISVGFLAAKPSMNGAPLNDQACDRLEMEIEARIKTLTGTREE
ncbi:hypothetical protein OAH36_02775 [Verrucomicrobia bacterium]|jgi:hypothetical protein|nr:hypothetical protein [Verrucomicrobiota bacterium]MDA7680744.1 hypothetical protein [bacterium]MDB4798503.1 hypothetical protein [Verrucomicrobiota bacterium]